MIGEFRVNEVGIQAAGGEQAVAVEKHCYIDLVERLARTQRQVCGERYHMEISATTQEQFIHICSET